MEVLVTGGANGIGRSTVELLIERGHSVSVIDYDSEALEELPEEVEAIDCDVREPEIVDVVAGIDLDAVINCAGFQEQGSIEDMPLEVFEEHIQTNYLGAVRVTKAALPLIKESGGKIINISSVAGISTAPFLGAYSASKYALEAFSDALRMELNSTDVDTVVVQPGPINTGFNREAAEKLGKYIPESVYSERYRERISSGMNGVGPEKPAEKIVDILEMDSPKARYTVTWQAYLVSKIKPFSPTFLYDKLASKF